MKKTILAIALTFCAQEASAQQGCYVDFGTPDQCFDGDIVWSTNDPQANLTKFGYYFGTVINERVNAEALYDNCNTKYGFCLDRNVEDANKIVKLEADVGRLKGEANLNFAQVSQGAGLLQISQQETRNCATSSQGLKSQLDACLILNQSANSTCAAAAQANTKAMAKVQKTIKALRKACGAKCKKIK